MKISLMRYILLIFFIFITSSTSASIAKIYGKTNLLEDRIPYIRVKMPSLFSKVKIKGLDIKRKFHLTNDIKFFPGRKKISINCSLLGKKQRFKKPTLVASFASNTGLLSVTEEKYQGLVHIVSGEDNSNCNIINETDLESYLGGLLSKEMNSKWPLEVLKAQAVAARTYAYHKIKTLEVSKKSKGQNLFHIENSEKHQVSGDFFDVTASTKKATEETIGEILLDGKGKLTSVFFHASCGGKTLLPQQVWQNSVNGYRSVGCDFCNRSKKKNWNHKFRKGDLNKFVNWLIKEKYISENARFHKHKKKYIVRSKKWDRNLRLYLGDKLYKIKKSHIRRFFGRFKIRSNNFDLKVKNGFVYLKGNGHGHGVGMCQLGALDLAKKGWSYKKILAHYLPGHKIQKIY